MPDSMEEQLLAECHAAERTAAAAEQVALAAEVAAGTAEQYATVAGKRADLANLALGNAYARFRDYLLTRDG